MVGARLTGLDLPIPCQRAVVASSSGRLRIPELVRKSLPRFLFVGDFATLESCVATHCYHSIRYHIAFHSYLAYICSILVLTLSLRTFYTFYSNLHESLDMIRPAIRQILGPTSKPIYGRAFAHAGNTSSKLLSSAFSTSTLTPSNKIVLSATRRVASTRPSNYHTFHRYYTQTAKMSAETRAESDAFGVIQVPADKYWGAQTER